MYAQVRHPWRTRPVRVIPKGRTCAAGSRHFAVLCLSATFDTTLAGTQQVHPCMLRCAILSAQGLYALYRKAELALLAPSSSQYFVYLPLSIQRSQARSKYILVCSSEPSLAHKACTRYTDRPNLRCWFPAPSSLHSSAICLSATFDTTLAGTQQVHPCMLRCAILGAHGLYALYRKANLRCWLPALRSPLFIWHFRYNARRHAASTSMYAQVRHHGAQGLYALYRKAELALLAPSSQLSAPSSQPSIFQTIIHPRLNSRTQVLLFSYNQVQLSFKVPVRKL